LKNWQYSQADETTKFWLNPTSQDVYRAGWFTLAQLQQWLAGQGPVIKPKG